MIDYTKCRLNFEGGYIDLPITPYAIDYEKYVDNFRVEENEWIVETSKWRTTPFDEEIKNAVDSAELKRLEKLRSSYTLTEEQVEGVTAARIHLLNALGSVIEGDFNLIPFEPINMPASDFMYDLETLEEISVIHIYRHLVNVIENYSPQIRDSDPVFTIDGVGYYFTTDTIISDGTGFTVGESISTLEFRNQYSLSVKNKGYDGNMDFSLSLKEIATLCRLKDERLPHKKQERYKWVNDRMKIIKDAQLSYADVLNVKFFFLHFIYGLKNVDFISGISNKPLLTKKVTLR